MIELDFAGGTGKKLTHATIILAGASSLLASLLSIVKNYRKPLLQRYVIRILLMVPIYSLSSWSSIVSLQAAMIAFTIYTFFQLLINFIGGERASIILMHGREPVDHLWPLNFCLPKVDISDPHSFLAIKRGILQYAWLKPILGFTSVIMKATGSYKEGYLGLDSGYLWSGIAYNLSVTISLYCLGLFWVCMSKDLQPFRPVPKFLCVKLIIFASYWQGFFLSILVWLGAIPDSVEGYTSDNIASAIQDSLICMEMPIFAIGHWYAFSWHDYADLSVSSARMPIKYALRDALGIRDLIEDTKETFSGKKYEYRSFDTGDDVLAHEDSSSRVARMMEGMRFERGGKGKYWIPKPGEISARTPLLPDEGYLNQSQSRSSSVTILTRGQCNMHHDKFSEEPFLDLEEESLYIKARTLEYGDWNYPVVTVHDAFRDQCCDASPKLLTTPANRYLPQPTTEYHVSRSAKTKKTVDQSNQKSNDSKMQSRRKQRKISGKIKSSDTVNERKHPMDSGFESSDEARLSNLTVRDTAVEDIEKIRAKRQEIVDWNQVKSKQFVKLSRTHGENNGEDTREGFDLTEENHTRDRDYFKGYEYSKNRIDSEGSQPWREVTNPSFEFRQTYGLPGEAFENVWIVNESSEFPNQNP
ncbi:Transmembrane protein 184-like protein [Golovinomyces cichoracearum]|uniref:Transmembrane protein 184-like protein n=1 Tax=Golovinomyces cichoracearum TaxID=62708 RepID=A0A420ICL5_9PEZI|nr:Transmembrane protein 184-like protein [Golovinomyces cichoracearum]